MSSDGDRLMSTRIIEPGTKFGRWTTLGLSKRLDSGQMTWLCMCSCGGAIRYVKSEKLLPNKERSCSCAVAERSKEVNTTHGLTRTPTYSSWRATVRTKPEQSPIGLSSKAQKKTRYSSRKSIDGFTEWRAISPCSESKIMHFISLIDR